MKKRNHLKSTLFFLTLLTTAFPLRAMNRGAAEEQRDEFSLASAPVTFIERAAAAEEDVDEGFCEGVASGEDLKVLLSKAEQGDQESQFELGLEYYLKDNFEEAARWLRNAASRGHPDAQHMLGYMYYKGLGVTQNLAESFQWYEKAAVQGYAEAQFKLGVMYEGGKDVEQDFQEAFRLFRGAANEGHAEAIKFFALRSSPPAPHVP
jgi:TPR repeat protein